MSDLALTSQEREIYHQFEEQRRIRLAQIIALTTLIITGVWSLVCTIYLLLHLNIPGFFVPFLTIVCWLATVCYALGVFSARRGHATLAAFFVCGGMLLASNSLLVFMLVTTGLNTLALALLFTMSIVVVISGVLASRPFLLGTTIVAVVGGCSVLIPSLHSPLLEQNPYGITLLFVAVLTSIGIMMLVFQQGYKRTLRELGDVRVAYERASALDELKNQFIINVNHELRNPVMAMMGYLDILDMSLATASLEDVHEATQEAISAANNLRTLLASILDANRLEQGPSEFVPERVPLVQSIQAAVQLLDPNEANLQNRDLQIKVHGDVSIWGEPIRLQQILTNLLSNAAKYSPPGTPIEVTAWVLKTPGSRAFLRRPPSPDGSPELVEITVRDWGLGIPPEQIPLLFQRFVRLPRDLASTIVGNGLGLYVCRLCAEAMGGRIWVESSGVEGEGAMFHLQLPAPPASAE
jgi:signal transduction histidine kinase